MDAFETELWGCRGALMQFAMALTGKRVAAEDYVQDTFTMALEHRVAYTPGTNLRAWLFTILRNKFYSAYRKEKHHDEYRSQVLYMSTEAIGSNQESEFEYKEVRALLRTFPKEHQRAIELVCIQGFSYKEAAQMEQVPVGTMKCHVSRARQTLRDITGRTRDKKTFLSLFAAESSEREETLHSMDLSDHGEETQTSASD